MPVAVQYLASSDDYLAVLGGHAQVSPPGERFAYNNGGFVVLGVIAERVTGVRFHELVVERVCRPADMHRTEFLRSDELPGDAALGYVTMDDAVRTNVLHLPVRGGGDGGVYTTLADMAAFWTAVDAGRVVSPAHVAAMHRPRSDVPAESKRYGLGFWVHATADIVMLEGYDAGVSFRSVHDPGRAAHPHGRGQHVGGSVADDPPRRARPRHRLTHPSACRHRSTRRGWRARTRRPMDAAATATAYAARSACTPHARARVLGRGWSRHSVPVERSAPDGRGAACSPTTRPGRPSSPRSCARRRTARTPDAPRRRRGDDASCARPCHGVLYLDHGWSSLVGGLADVVRSQRWRGAADRHERRRRRARRPRPTGCDSSTGGRCGAAAVVLAVNDRPHVRPAS